jgi:hypothetical protein
MAERKAVTEVTRERYRRSGKKEKGLILDEFTALTGYDIWLHTPGVNRLLAYKIKGISSRFLDEAKNMS